MKTQSIYTFHGRSALLLLLTSTLGSAGFLWPFFISQSHQNGKWFFLAAAPLALIALLLTISQDSLDAKSIALLAVLSALIAATRPLGTGAVGIEPMWFILILSARVFGASFGFVLGALSMLLSAVITGGFGPWLGYQCFAAGWIGLGVAAIPSRIRGKFEIGLLALYGVLAAEFFGILMDLQFWPWALGSSSQLSYRAGAPISENFGNFFSYHFFSSMAWDIPRAVFTATMIVVSGKPVLRALRRAYVKAAFMTPIEFVNERVKARAEVQR